MVTLLLWIARGISFSIAAACVTLAWNSSFPEALITFIAVAILIFLHCITFERVALER